MAKEEFERLKEALRKSPTPEARKEAAEAFKEYERTRKAAGRPSSRPTLVSLGYKKPYPTAVPLDKIPEELERNPAFFEHFREIVEEG